jgi:PEP-CTERM motif-containing protein
MTRRASVGLTLLTMALALPAALASADPIRITSGSVLAEGAGAPLGRAFGTGDVHGTQGFSAHIRLGLTTAGPWGCCPAAPGTPIDLRAFFDASEGVVDVELNGMSFVAPSSHAYIQLHPLGGPVLAPPLTTSAILSTSFRLDSAASGLSLFDFEGEPTVEFPLRGRGTATLELAPNAHGAQAWEFVRVRYDFEPAAPTSEPATLLLLGSGMLAVAVRRFGGSRRPGDA